MRRRVNNQNQQKRNSSDQHIHKSTTIAYPTTNMSSLPPAYEESFGITKRRPPSISTIGINISDAADGNLSRSTSPLPPPKYPLISEFMLHDENFRRGQQQSNECHASLTFSQQQYLHNRTYNIQCAKFCAVFSFIAVLFLVMVGVLIEVQPLYIKGISPERVPMSLRRMRERGNMGENELLSYVHYSGRLRMLQSYYIHQPSSQQKQKDKSKNNNNMIPTFTYDDDPVTKYAKYNEYLRSLSNEQKEYIIYEMKSEAKTSFKAAALYFVVMVFSIIYTQNFDRVHIMFGLGCSLLWLKLKHLGCSGGLRHIYNNYRRRNYNDISDKKNYRGGGDNVAPNSLKRSSDVSHSRGGGAGSNEISRNSSFDSTIGLSMRDREMSDPKKQ